MAYLRILCVLLVVSCAASAQTVTKSCPAWSFNWTNPVSTQTQTDYTDHPSGGNHQAFMTVDGSCEYSAIVNTNLCEVQCAASLSARGERENPPAQTGYRHQGNYSYDSGGAGSNGGQAVCGGEVAAAIRSCPSSLPSCDITVNLAATPMGFGGGVVYNNPTIWAPTMIYSYTCIPHKAITSKICYPPTSPPRSNYAGYQYVWNYNTCTWQLVECPTSGCNSPILIDTDGSGFQLTSKADGVIFDFAGDGQPARYPWTAKGSKNGWLVRLPKGKQVESARDMFGNLTAQYVNAGHDPNGFAALAIYDTNNNGVIDAGDADWGLFYVWIDANHNGISEKEELHPLDEIGIAKIDLRYHASRFVDKYGNRFSYKGDLVPINNNDDVDRKIFDVFLTAK